MPTPLTTFVGRTSELAEVQQLIETWRLVTVVGPPGIGKTRLALRVAHAMHPRTAHTVVVELGALSDPDLVASSIAAALNIREQPGKAFQTTLAEQLGERHLLLLLDNCEHLVDCCASLASLLLAACPGLRILATSRQSLNVIGEATYRLAPLEPDDALHLLVERGATVVPGFAATPTNAEALARICTRLERIPLAIELTAVWLRVLSVDDIAVRLDDSLRLLARGSRGAPPRQQTLDGAVEWSYGLLSDAERRLFNRLSVFAGGWTLGAAETVVAGDVIPPADVLPLLDQLVDKSLVVVDHRGQAVRYRMLETLRAYAADRLAESTDGPSVQARHVNWSVELAETGEREIWRGEQVGWVARLQLDQDNLRAALTWTLSTASVDPEPGLRIAAAMARFWDTQGDVREGTTWLSALLALPAVRRATPAWGRALTALGYLVTIQGDSPRAVRLLDEALVYWEALGDPRALAVAVFFRGLAIGWNGDLASVPLFKQSLELSRERGPRWVTYLSLSCLGEAARITGDPDAADQFLGESLSLTQAAGDRWGAFFALNSLALLALMRADTDAAEQLGRDALTTAVELSNARGATLALETLACVAAARGRVRGAARLFGAAQALRAPIGDFTNATVRVDRERGIATARGQLGQHTFDTEWQTGQRMTLSQATAYARSLRTARRRPSDARAPGKTALTAREIEVLRLVAEGCSNREIAERLTIGPPTVKRHLDNLFAKLGVSTRAAAATAALRAGLV